uniref:Olfactory receptor 95 n=1 Tax=Aulacocentrum confusum TaxID=2767324 RepID=A0A7G8Z9B4_9HYME|nr:olfactory receptor 95 [Aulacocentrum confusum]
MKHINDDWIQIKNQKHRELMRKNMHWGKRATMACSVLMYAGAVSYNIIMPASEHILSHASGRMPAFPGYDVAFDAQDSPIYEIMLIGYLYGAFIAHTVTICSNHLAILSVSHVYGQLEILEDYIRGITNAVKFNKPQSVHVEIATIVSHHCRITKFLKAVKKVLYEICLIDVLVSTLLICLGEYSILQVYINFFYAYLHVEKSRISERSIMCCYDLGISY